MALRTMRCFSTQNPLRQFSTQAQVQGEGAAHIQHEVEVPIDPETATPAQLHQSPQAKKLRERYPNIKVSRLPRAFFTLDLERDIIPQEEKLIS